MDDLDRRAISLLINSTTLNYDEMKDVLRELKKMAKMKKKEFKDYSVKDILDYWGTLAYKESFKLI
ncbi:hypothetical protein [Methanocaldococcus infernus]